MALLDLSWTAEFFTKLSLVMLKKSSTCSSKFLKNFIKKAFVLSNGCNTIYCTISILYIDRWVAPLNSVLRIEIAVNCMHMFGRR